MQQDRGNGQLPLCGWIFTHGRGGRAACGHMGPGGGRVLTVAAFGFRLCPPRLMRELLADWAWGALSAAQLVRCCRAAAAWGA
jgi:hypothetical protein